MAKRKRRATAAVVVLLGVALWFLIDLPGVPREGGPGAGAPATGAPVRGQLTAPARSTAELASNPGTGTAAADPAVVPLPSTDGPGVLDGLYGALHVIRGAIERGSPAAGFAAVERATHPDLSDWGRAQLDDATVQLRQMVEAQLEAVAEGLGEGSVLAVAGRLQRLRTPPHHEVETAVAAAWARHGWPRLAPRDGALPLRAEPLAANQRVRIRHRGEVREGRVAATANSGEVTVRIRDAEQVQFGIAPRAAIEPIDATVDQALAQLRAAHTAGDALLAELWLVRVWLSAPDDPRIEAWTDGAVRRP